MVGSTAKTMQEEESVSDKQNRQGYEADKEKGMSRNLMSPKRELVVGRATIVLIIRIRIKVLRSGNHLFLTLLDVALTVLLLIKPYPFNR